MACVHTGCLPAEMDERKAALIEALAAKCSALLELQQATAAPAAASEQALAASAAAAGGEPAAAEAAAADEAQAPSTTAAAASASSSAAEPGEFETAFRELRRWVDTAAVDKVGGRVPPCNLSCISGKLLPFVAS